MASPMSSGPVGIYVGLPASDVATATAPLAISAGGFNFPGGAAAGGIAAVAQGVALSLARLSFPPILLGTGQAGPRIRVKRAYAQVWNDITGPELAFDRLWAGAEGMIFVDLTRWNESVYFAIGARPRSGATVGAEPPFTRGTLMMTEGMNFPLYLRFPAFDSHPYYRANGGVAGYRFLSCCLDDNDELETGSAANIRHIAFHATDDYDPRSNGLALCDFNMTGIPAILPN